MFLCLSTLTHQFVYDITCILLQTKCCQTPISIGYLETECKSVPASSTSLFQGSFPWLCENVHYSARKWIWCMFSWMDGTLSKLLWLPPEVPWHFLWKRPSLYSSILLPPERQGPILEALSRVKLHRIIVLSTMQVCPSAYQQMGMRLGGSGTCRHCTWWRWWQNKQKGCPRWRTGSQLSSKRCPSQSERAEQYKCPYYLKDMVGRQLEILSSSLYPYPQDSCSFSPHSKP